jgi:hypothetical protein
VRAAASQGPRRRRLPLPAVEASGRSCDTLYTELADGQGGAPRGRARELTGGVGRRSRSQGEGRRSSGRRSWWAKPARFACCKSMICVFEVFQKNVASVKSEYCKSRP